MHIFHIIIFVLFFIVFLFLNRDKSNKNININYIQKISSLLSNCKNLIKSKNFTINSVNDLDNYLNYLSCNCKGIGYWGGFCLDKVKKVVGYNYVYDEILANTLGKIFSNKKVVDLGAGLGWYCPIVSKYSKVCDEFDGSVNIEEVTDGRVKYLNLAEPINIECNYDYVMSIEVAEHIPKTFENVYLNNLIKCAKKGIVITWATIGQEGHFHVNNKAKEDVIKFVESKGLKYDDVKTKEIANGTKIGYLKRNIMYFSI